MAEVLEPGDSSIFAGTMEIRSFLEHFKTLIVSALVALAFILIGCGPSENQTAETTAPVKNEATSDQKANELPVILFFGNSLTAGYQLEEEESFPFLIQRKIDSAGYGYKVINAGLSGETSAGGLGRINWVLKQDVDLFVLELGPNDALRGLDLDETKKNLRGILERVREKDPQMPIIIAGMVAPPNMGKEFAEKFASIYSELAEEFNAGLVPFLLDGVAGIPELNLKDGIHPNPDGQKIVAENVWSVLREYL